jgi:hypothetical protein
MRIVGFGRFALTVTVCIVPLGACGNDDGSSSSPEGSCKTGGTATGSYAAACNECGKQRCNAELSRYAGSGWSQQYFGGDGACAAFTACTCQCLASRADPLECATTKCIGSMSTECQAAVQAALDCIDAKCGAECP